MTAYPRRRWGHRFLVALIATLLTTGSQTVMSTPHSSDDDGTIVRNTFPLKFKEHNFGAYCFNTIGCKVLYANRYQTRDEPGEVEAPPAPDYLDRLRGTQGGIENFPPPAVVTWRSLDGVQHEVKVDVSEIFKDRQILHNVPEKDIPEDIYVNDPDIILVVNDRTISVYMRAFIPLKEPRVQGNPNSDYRDDIVLAYTNNY